MGSTPFQFFRWKSRPFRLPRWWESLVRYRSRHAHGLPNGPQDHRDSTLRVEPLCSTPAHHMKSPHEGGFSYGGDGGSRTHVQNQVAMGSTCVVCCLKFLSRHESKHPCRYSSLCYLTGPKTLPRSCSPLIHALSLAVALKGRTGRQN